MCRSTSRFFLFSFYFFIFLHFGVYLYFLLVFCVYILVIFMCFLFILLIISILPIICDYFPKILGKKFVVLVMFLYVCVVNECYFGLKSFKFATPYWDFSGFLIEIDKLFIFPIKIKKTSIRIINFKKSEFMKELKLKFAGTGEVRGYEFRQLLRSPFGYIYEKTHVESGTVSFEVFKRVENRQFDCVSYPRSSSFGVWAWEFGSFEKALSRFKAFCGDVRTNFVVNLQFACLYMEYISEWSEDSGVVLVEG